MYLFVNGTNEKVFNQGFISAHKYFFVLKPLKIRENPAFYGFSSIFQTRVQFSVMKATLE